MLTDDYNLDTCGLYFDSLPNLYVHIKYDRHIVRVRRRCAVYAGVGVGLQQHLHSEVLTGSLPRVIIYYNIQIWVAFLHKYGLVPESEHDEVLGQRYERNVGLVIRHCYKIT